MSTQITPARKWLFSTLSFGIAFALSSLIITVIRSGKLGSTFPWPVLGYWALLVSAGMLSLLVVGQVFRWIFPNEQEFKPVPSVASESTPPGPSFGTTTGEMTQASGTLESEETDTVSPFGQEQQKIAS